MPEKVISSDKSQVLVPASSFAATAQAPVRYPEQGHFGQIPEGKNRALSSARNLLQLAQERDFARLNQLREFPDPRLPVAAHRDELAKEAAKAKAGFSTAYDNAVQTLTAEMRDNESHIAAMGGFTVNPQAAEIRGIIRGMDRQEREALIGNAVEALDEKLLACIMDAMPLSLGVSPEFMAAMRDRYLQKVVPDYLALRENLATTKAKLEAAKPLIEAAYDKAGSGIEAFAAQIAKAEAARTTKH